MAFKMRPPLTRPLEFVRVNRPFECQSTQIFALSHYGGHKCRQG
jgi:hypothetical protein